MKKCYEWIPFLGLVFAASLANAQQQQGGPPPMPPGLQQAMQDCAKSLGITPPSPGGQRPSQADMEKLKSCLSQKGFTPPSGPPPGGGAGGPPPGGPPPGGWSQQPDSSQGSTGSGSAQ